MGRGQVRLDGKKASEVWSMEVGGYWGSFGARWQGGQPERIRGREDATGGHVPALILSFSE